MRKFFASILSFFGRFRIPWQGSKNSEVLVAIEQLKNTIEKQPPVYAFPHMSRMVDRLLGGNPCLSRSENPGIVCIITKCDKVMSADEAQLVLDESRVEYDSPCRGQLTSRNKTAEARLAEHNKKFHEIN